MTYEEAIEHTEKSIALCEGIGVFKDNLDYWETVKSPLEKQIPKKPTRDLRKGIECYCPICKSYVGYFGNDNTQNSYCSDCGQRIDWSEKK